MAYFDESRPRRDALKAGLQRCFEPVTERAGLGGKAGGRAGGRKRVISLVEGDYPADPIVL